MAVAYSPAEYTWLKSEVDKILGGVGDYMASLGALHEKAMDRTKCSQESYDLLIIYLKRHRIGKDELRAAMNVHKGLVPSSLYFLHVDIKRMVNLPIEIQRDIASGKKYDVMTEDGSLVQLDAFEMSKMHQKQVFGDGRIVPFAEQVVAGLTKKDKKYKVLQHTKFKIDDEDGPSLQWRKDSLYACQTLEDLVLALVDEDTYDVFIEELDIARENLRNLKEAKKI